jgi:hypothetical protein
VAFYVPLGLRGLIFQLGTFVIGIWGGLVYRLAYHRRAIVLGNQGPFPTIGLGAGIYAALDEAPPMSEMLVTRVTLSDRETAAVV